MAFSSLPPERGVNVPQLTSPLLVVIQPSPKHAVMHLFCTSSFILLSQDMCESSCACTIPVSQGCATLDSTGILVTFCSLRPMGPVPPWHRGKPSTWTSLVLPNTEGHCPEGWEVAEGDLRKQRSWWIRECRQIFTPSLFPGRQGKVRLFEQQPEQLGRRWPCYISRAWGQNKDRGLTWPWASPALVRQISGPTAAIILCPVNSKSPEKLCQGRSNFIYRFQPHLRQAALNVSRAFPSMYSIRLCREREKEEELKLSTPQPKIPLT